MIILPVKCSCCLQYYLFKLSTILSCLWPLASRAAQTQSAQSNELPSKACKVSINLLLLLLFLSQSQLSQPEFGRKVLLTVGSVIPGLVQAGACQKYTGGEEWSAQK